MLTGPFTGAEGTESCRCAEPDAGVVLGKDVGLDCPDTRGLGAGDERVEWGPPDRDPCPVR
jgi:hypothetical protein